MKQTKPDDWDSDIYGPWEDEEEPEKPAEDEPLFIGSEMSDSQPVAPTRGRGRVAAATTKTTKKAAAPKKAVRSNKKATAARGRAKKVVDSEEEDEEEEDEEEINEEDDMAMSDVMDAASDMDVDEEEEEIVPVKKTYVSFPWTEMHINDRLRQTRQSTSFKEEAKNTTSTESTNKKGSSKSKD